MPSVTESFPGAAVTANQKSDVQAVPSGADDSWWASADANKVLQLSAAVSRAIRMNALMAFVTGAASAVNARAFRIDALADGLPRANTALTTDLNKLWAAAVEAIEQGGGLDGTASGTAGFGVPCGVVTIASGSFPAGTLLGLSSDGSLVTHAAGARPPIGIVLDDTTAYVDMSGRLLADNTGIQIDANGKIILKGQGAITQTYATASAVHSNPTATALTGTVSGTANGAMESLPDPADGLSSADALRDDLVANLIPAMRNNQEEFLTRINQLIADMANAKNVLNSTIDKLQSGGLIG